MLNHIDRFLRNNQLVEVDKSAQAQALGFVKGLLPKDGQLLTLPSTLMPLVEDARGLVKAGFNSQRGNDLVCNLARAMVLETSCTENDYEKLWIARQMLRSTMISIEGLADQLVAQRDGAAIVRLAHVWSGASDSPTRSEDKKVVQAYARRALARPSDQEIAEFDSWWCSLGMRQNGVNMVKLKAKFYTARLIDMTNFALTGADGYSLLYLQRRVENGDFVPEEK